MHNQRCRGHVASHGSCCPHNTKKQETRVRSHNQFLRQEKHTTTRAQYFCPIILPPAAAVRTPSDNQKNCWDIPVPGSRQRRPQRAPAGISYLDDKTEGAPVYGAAAAACGIASFKRKPSRESLVTSHNTTLSRLGPVTPTLSCSPLNHEFFSIGRYSCARQDSLRPVVGQSLHHTPPHLVLATKTNQNRDGMRTNHYTRYKQLRPKTRP